MKRAVFNELTQWKDRASRMPLMVRGARQIGKTYIIEQFGEAYFSQIDKGAIKAWKRHKKMTLNLVVPVGEIKFVLFDDRDASSSLFQEVIISKSNYCRLTVPPLVWMGFQGLSSKGSMLLNIANIEHNPHEAERLEIDKINYNWSID